MGAGERSTWRIALSLSHSSDSVDVCVGGSSSISVGKGPRRVMLNVGPSADANCLPATSFYSLTLTFI